MRQIKVLTFPQVFKDQKSYMSGLIILNKLLCGYTTPTWHVGLGDLAIRQ